VASDYSIGVKVSLIFNQAEIDSQILKMQTAIDKNNLKVRINISEEAIKGLERLAQGAKTETEKIKKGFEKMVTPLAKMKDIKILTQDWQKDENGVLRLTKSIGVLHTVTGNTVQITQQLVQQYNDAGEKTKKVMMQSTQKITKLNQDMIDKLKNDLGTYKQELNNIATALRGSKVSGAIDKEGLAYLDALDKKLKGLKLNEDLRNNFIKIKADLKDIKTNADIAFRALNNNTNNTNKATTTLFDFKNPSQQEQAYLLAVSKMEQKFRAVGVEVKHSNDLMGNTTIHIKEANNEVTNMKYTYDRINQSLKLANGTMTQNKVMSDLELNNIKEKYRLQIQDRSSKVSYASQIAEMQRLLALINSLTPATANLKTTLGSIPNQLKAMDLKAQSEQISIVNSRVQTFGETIARAATKMMVWLGVGTIIFGAIQQIKDALNFIKDMDYTFTTLQMEMTNTVLDFKELTTSANKFAISMGSSTQNVAEAIKVFGNYNNTISETMNRSKAAVIMSNLTGDSIKNSSSAILAVQMQFKMSADSALHIVDVFSGVARNLQIDYGDAMKEVANGIERVGSVAEMAGLKFEKLSAMVGTTAEVTRMSGDVIGNAYKTIFSRITNVGDEADADAFKKIEKSFYDIGVSIKSSATTIKPMGDIFDELAIKWKTMNDVEKNQIALDAAGVRQKNIFLATMDNWEKVLNNTKAAEDSEGVAMQKQAIYMESLTAKLIQLKETFNQFYLSLADSSTLKTFVELSTVMMGVLNKFSGVIGGLPVVFGLAVFAISAFSTHAKINQAAITRLMATYLNVGPLKSYILLTRQTATELAIMNSTMKGAFVIPPPTALSYTGGAIIAIFKSIGIGAKALWATIKQTFSAMANLGFVGSLRAGLLSIQGGFKSLTVAIAGSTMAMAAFQMIATMGLIWAISKLFEGLGKLYNRVENAKKVFKDLSVEISSLKGNIIEANTLLAQLQELQEKQNNQTLNTEDSQKLLDLKVKLAEILPNTTTGYTAEGKAISDNSDMIREQIALNKELAKSKQQELINSSIGKDTRKEYQDNNEDLQKLIKLRETYKKGSLDNQNNPVVKLYYDTNLKNVTKEISELYPELDKSKTALNDWIIALDESSDGAKLGALNINALINVLKESKDIDMEKLIPNLKNSTFIDELKSANEELNKMRDSGSNQNELNTRYDELAERLQHLLQYEGKMSDSDGQSFLNKVFKIPNVRTATQDIKDLTDATLQFNTKIKTQANELGEINQLISDNNNGIKVQGSNIMDLILKYPDLTEAMIVQNGQISFSTAGLEILRLKRIDEMKTSLNAEIEKVNATQNGVGARLKAYGVEIDALMTLAEAQDEIAEGQKRLYEEASESGDAGIQNKKIAQFQKDADNIIKLVKAKENMDKLINQVFTNDQFGVNTSKADSNASKAESAAEREAQAWETLTDELNKYIDAVTIAQQKRKEDFDATGAKLHAGFLAGADASSAKIQTEETYVNDLFGAYNDLQKSILDWRVKQDKFKVGTREYDAIENKIKEINELQAKSSKLAEAEVPILAKMKKEWNDMYKPIETMKNSFNAVESKIKSVSETFKNSIRDISTKVNFNTIMNTDSSGTGKELFESLLNTYKARITDFYSLMDDLRRVDTQKTDQFVALTKKKNEGTISESEEAILNEISNWDELNDKLVEYGLTVEEITKIQKDYAEISAIVTKQENERKKAKSNIEAEQAKLEKMNDQLTIEKQITDLRDKQLKLAQAQDDIEKEKLNRNNEVILASGEKTLTYDVSKVQELYKAKEIAQKEVDDTLRQQDLESQKEAISDEIKAKQQYLDTKLPELQEKEMAQYVTKWSMITNKQFSQENALGVIQTAGANSRIETMKLELKAVRELWDLRIKNASEAGKAEKEAFASGLAGNAYIPANYSNPNMGSSVKIVNNIVSIDGISLTNDESKGFIDYLRSLGLIENSN